MNTDLNYPFIYIMSEEDCKINKKINPICYVRTKEVYFLDKDNKAVTDLARDMTDEEKKHYDILRFNNE